MTSDHKKNQHNKKMGLPRILIVGCGDIGLRILPLLCGQLTHPAYRVFALTRHADRCAVLRAAGAVPVLGNLDDPLSLARLANLANSIIYLAPPPSVGGLDKRSRHLAAVLSHRCRMVYISTSGVYGDCGGALITETQPIRPCNLRAVRRADAEQVWRKWAQRTDSSLSILRVPGIYASNRLPLDRLHNQTPALLPEQDVYTNHIHAQDLARLIVVALWRGRPNRIYHAVDDSSLLMGDYFDLVADHYHLPRAPRLSRVELQSRVSPMQLSFMSESRRMSNARIKQELGFQLRYPLVADGV
jgi:nucleoside-diphosphate-sugar epimerase